VRQNKKILTATAAGKILVLNGGHAPRKLKIAFFSPRPGKFVYRNCRARRHVTGPAWPARERLWVSSIFGRPKPVFVFRAVRGSTKDANAYLIALLTVTVLEPALQAWQGAAVIDRSHNVTVTVTSNLSQPSQESRSFDDTTNGPPLTVKDCRRRSRCITVRELTVRKRKLPIHFISESVFAAAQVCEVTVKAAKL
jgi:hypothetical protein